MTSTQRNLIEEMKLQKALNNTVTMKALVNIARSAGENEGIIKMLEEIKGGN
jgi:hypothetical protein